MKDPKSGNLDRIQIVKGWIDAAGKQHEKIYDVVWTGDRKPGADGKLPPVGNTVDRQARDLHEQHRRARNSPQAGPIPTSSRASAPSTTPACSRFRRRAGAPIDAARHEDAPLTKVPATIQERAWSSPIWYTPGSDDGRLLKEPLLHFLLLGAAIFIAYG